MHTAAGQMRRKKQEQRVARALDAAKLMYTREHIINFRCMADFDNAYARVDFVLHEDGRVIFLEVDEDQHKFGYGSVGCDMKRMSKILESLSLGGNTLPILFIRYNPNRYTVDGQPRRTPRAAREAQLVRLLSRDLQGVAQAPLTILHMFYDVAGGRVCAVQDPEYHPHLAECCGQWQ